MASRDLQAVVQTEPYRAEFLQSNSDLYEIRPVASDRLFPSTAGSRAILGSNAKKSGNLLPDVSFHVPGLPHSSTLPEHRSMAHRVPHDFQKGGDPRVMIECLQSGRITQLPCGHSCTETRWVQARWTPSRPTARAQNWLRRAGRWRVRGFS